MREAVTANERIRDAMFDQHNGTCRPRPGASCAGKEKVTSSMSFVTPGQRKTRMATVWQRRANALSPLQAATPDLARRLEPGK